MVWKSLKEINACAALLDRDPRLRCYETVRLHSTVAPREQHRAFERPADGKRKAIGPGLG